MSFSHYPAYKPSGVEWLGEVPEHWELSRLGFESWVRARLGWKGLKAEEYVDSGFAFLSTPNIKGRLIDFSNVNYIDIDRYDESPEIKLSSGDVLLAKDGSTLGIANVVRTLPVSATVNSSIAVITPCAKLDSIYLYYLLCGSGMQQLIQQKKGGMGVPHLFQSDLVKFAIPIPASNEQCAIATFLDRETAKIDALIAEQQRLIELLQEKRQAVISHAVTKGLNPHAPMKDSGVEWLGEVPAHWTVIPLRLAARIESGHTPSRSHNEYWIEKDCVHHWFTLGDVWQIRDGKAEYVYETQEKVSQAGLDNSAARMLPANTVILSRTASVGFSGILGVPMATTQDFVNWVCGPKIVPEFLLFVFRAMSKEFERLKYGSTHNTIYMPDIFSFRAPLPSLIEQGEIVSNVRESLRRLDASFDDLFRSKELLQERRSALISAAVTGQIDVRGLVPEAEAA